MSRTEPGAGPGGVASGGGIHVEGPTARLDVIDTLVQDNAVRANGGAAGGPGGIVRGGGIHALVDTIVHIIGGAIAGNTLAANGMAAGSPGGIAEGAGLYVSGFDTGANGLELTAVRVRLNTIEVNGGAGSPSSSGVGGIGEGAGIHFDAFGGGSAALIRVAVSQNTVSATGGPPRGGGGVARGGGAYLSTDGGTIVISDATFDRNSLASDGGGGGGNGGTTQGGGLYLSGSDATMALDRVSFFQNAASSRGGGGGNGGSAFGGALAHGGSEVTGTLTNVTAAQNTADASRSAPGTGGTAFGGGVFWSGGTVTVRSSTLSANVAVAPGGSAEAGGIGHDGADVRLASTIVAANTAPVGPDCLDTVTSLGHNLIGDGAGCTGVSASAASTEAFAASDKIGVPAGLGAFADDGRPGHGHLPLVSGSQAVDAGGAGCPPTDQLGQDRSGQCDIGAVELVPATTLLAAVLPASRSVSVGAFATAFASIINVGSAPAFNVGIAPAAPLAGHFTFQTTDPATNALTGSPNIGIEIPPGGRQSYVIAVRPFAAFAPVDAAFAFAAVNGPPAASVVGLNTLLLSAALGPVPDIVALAATLGNDGIVDLFSTSAALLTEAAAGAFSVATVNVGAGGLITATPDTGSVVLPVTLSICRSEPATGVCLGAAGSSVTASIGPGETPTFAVFASSGGSVPFDPANNRIFVRFSDPGGVVRGATSVAVRTR